MNDRSRLGPRPGRRLHRAAWSPAPDRELSPADDARLTRLALAAKGGDRQARDRLYRELEPGITRMVAGCARLTWASDCARRDGRPWDREDLAQEAFLIFCELIRVWSGEGPFTPYVYAYFPWRLRNAWRRLRPDRPRGVVIHRGGPDLELTVDPSASAAEALVLLEALAGALPEEERHILLAHVRDGHSLAEAARRLGLRPHQLRRRWQDIKRWLRSELEPRGDRSGAVRDRWSGQE